MEKTRLKKAQEVAEVLGIRLARVYALYRQGEFNDFVVRVGEKQLRFRTDGLEAYIARGGRQGDQHA